MLAFRWRPAPGLIDQRWRGGCPAYPAIPQPGAPSSIATIIGPPGPPSAPLVGTSPDAVGGHRAVAALGDGGFRAVGPDDPLAESVVGLTAGAAVAGGIVTVQTTGPMSETGWSWSPGPVWLGAGGVPTQSRPTSGALVRLGEAISPTIILINPRLIARLQETYNG